MSSNLSSAHFVPKCRCRVVFCANIPNQLSLELYSAWPGTGFLVGTDPTNGESDATSSLEVGMIGTAAGSSVDLLPGRVSTTTGKDGVGAGDTTRELGWTAGFETVRAR